MLIIVDQLAYLISKHSELWPFASEIGHCFPLPPKMEVVSVLLKTCLRTWFNYNVQQHSTTNRFNTNSVQRLYTLSEARQWLHTTHV